jgi:hypothetical protein
MQQTLSATFLAGKQKEIKMTFLLRTNYIIREGNSGDYNKKHDQYVTNNHCRKL